MLNNLKYIFKDILYERDSNAASIEEVDAAINKPDSNLSITKREGQLTLKHLRHQSLYPTCRLSVESNKILVICSISLYLKSIIYFVGILFLLFFLVPFLTLFQNGLSEGVLYILSGYLLMLLFGVVFFNFQIGNFVEYTQRVVKYIEESVQ